MDEDKCQDVEDKECENVAREVIEEVCMEDFEEVCEEPDLSAQPKEVCNVRIVQTCTNGTRVATKQRCNPVTENKCR